MKCLILSAGKGTRLQPRYSCKPLAPVLGIPLIERVIPTAVCAGVEEFYIVTGYKGTEVSQFLAQLAEQCRILINQIHNDEWYKGGNGLSALKAKAHLNEHFLLMKGDHLVDPARLKSLLQNPLSDGDIRCLSKNGNVKVHDIGEKFWINVDDPVALKKA